MTTTPLPLDDMPLVVEALLACVAVMAAEACVETNAFAPELQREQVVRADTLARELFDTLRRL